MSQKTWLSVVSGNLLKYWYSINTKLYLNVAMQQGFVRKVFSPFKYCTKILDDVGFNNLMYLFLIFVLCKAQIQPTARTQQAAQRNLKKRKRSPEKQNLKIRKKRRKC